MGEIMSMKVGQCHYSILDAIFLLRYLQDPSTPQIIGDEGLEVVKRLFDEELECLCLDTIRICREDGSWRRLRCEW